MKIAVAAALSLHALAFAGDEVRFTSGLGIAVPSPRSASRTMARIDPVEAMVQAGIVRLRPILMTALSTVAGILPIAIGFGAGAESRRPMGVAVVGGMVTSTVLTLLVIPVVYVVFASLQSHARPSQPGDAAAGQAGGKEPTPPAANPTPSLA